MLRFFSTIEKVAVVALLIIVMATSWYLWGRYVRDHSELIAAEGGIYTEGVIGRPQFLNPVLLIGNPVDRDLSQLLFSGLTRYNPHTGLIEDDIATSEKSNDNLSYTFTILPDAVWHDGAPVTADDVIFTYNTVLKNPAFHNVGLRQVFDDVTIQKVDEKVVVFRLSEPYSFFLSNVTVGLLPKHILEAVPADNLDKSDFNQSPIGTGPYQFSSWTVADQTHELTLKRFDRYYAAVPKIQTIIFRVFPDQGTLLLAENTLNGFRLNTDLKQDSLDGDSSRFTPLTYRLPQYSALFLNTESPILSNKKVRFALLLATDKQQVVDEVGNAVVVDTPILESKADLDIEYSLERSRGAFFDTEWHLPGKVNPNTTNGHPNDTNVTNKMSDGSGGPVDASVIDNATELTFKITATADSWVSFDIDGVAKPSILFSKGVSKTYTVKKSLVFRVIGNAAGITVEVNGLKLKSLGKEGQVIRNLTLDRKTIGQYLDESQEALPVEPPPLPPVPESLLPLSDLPPPLNPDGTTSTPTDVPVSLGDSDELHKVRVNSKGERLILRLVTAQEPASFLNVAELIQKQWLEAGAKVVIETYSLADLQDKIKKRDYDILLFGQNLGYNLDAFPFWHSSQSKDGLNLSNYHSLETDNLLVDVRKTFDERTKQVYLDKLKRVIAEDTPAIFLYSPIHSYMVDKTVKNVDLGKLSSHADRFTDIINWYVREDYRLTEGLSFGGVLSWIFGY